MRTCFMRKIACGWLLVTFLLTIGVFGMLHLSFISESGREDRHLRHGLSRHRPVTGHHISAGLRKKDTRHGSMESKGALGSASEATQTMIRMITVSRGAGGKGSRSVRESSNRTFDGAMRTPGSNSDHTGKDLLKRYVESLDKFRLASEQNISSESGRYDTLHDAVEVQSEKHPDGRTNGVPNTSQNASATSKIGGAVSDDIFQRIKDPLGNYEDIEMMDDRNVNADVARAVPALGVKRYEDESVDPHEYRYIHNRPDHCKDDKGIPRRVFMLFVVVTAPANFERRNVIRMTYGNESQWPALKKGVFTTVFLLGATDNVTLQGRIDEESRVQRDVLQEDFVDSYANLSRKTVMGLKWATNFCRHALYVMKIDDDSMLNQGKLLWTFKGATVNNWTASEALIAAPVLRNTDNKYFISEEYYPSPTYPPYLNGPGYILSTDLVEESYKIALTTPLFPWEDVFLGTCLAKLGVEPVRHKFFLWISDPGYFDANIEIGIVKRLRLFVVVSNLSAHRMKLMWLACKIRIVTPK